MSAGHAHTLLTGSAREGSRPVRLAPGTRVTAVIGGAVRRDGVVQHYEPENAPHHHGFPVRFGRDPQWWLLSVRDVTVVSAPGDAR